MVGTTPANTFNPATLSPKLWLDAKDIDGDGILSDVETETCSTIYPSQDVLNEDFESIGNGTL
jgi:hypothetical protein